VLNALKHPGTKSTSCKEVRNKYGTENNKSENQDYSLTICEVMYGGFRGFGGTCSAYPEDECTKFLSNYPPNYKACYSRQQSSPEILSSETSNFQ
jgi:hypothetical protein